MTAVALLASCSNGDDGRTSAPPPTTLEVTTSSSSPSSSTTTVVTTTAVTSRSTTTVPPLSPEASAKALYDAWTRADRTAAEKVAQPAAVTELFNRRWQAGDGWSFSECSGAAGSLICTWQRPAGQLLMRVQNAASGLPVAEVRFQP
ncbi:MAG: hypothetical protein ACR2KK_20260 [Acidimicrobiales bacterium]